MATKPSKLPTFVNRAQLAEKCDCAQTLIERIYKAGFLDSDAHDLKDAPLWLASRVARARRLVADVKRTGSVKQLKWIDYTPPPPTIDELVEQVRRSVKWGWKLEELSSELRAPEVVAAYRARYETEVKS